MKRRQLGYHEGVGPSGAACEETTMTPDFNLLITLDALLEEGSVAGAARRLGLSASAMSRAPVSYTNLTLPTNPRG
ncbi:helix-turn-helix domain-containing protein [Aeromonas caviae]|uniref:helix-turn-helix domain-containing protein n=1 Tax=Aeromonas caviae TaxID=648 RepID=UPI0025B65712|nr:LysR family transcriptional regulator [Aeromonas caviae]